MILIYLGQPGGCKYDIVELVQKSNVKRGDIACTEQDCQSGGAPCIDLTANDLVLS